MRAIEGGRAVDALKRRAARLLLVWTVLASAFWAAPGMFGAPTAHAAAVAPSVASRSTAMSAAVGAPAGVTSADHVALHTLFVDRSSTAPVWVEPAGFALRYQHSRSVGSGYVFHFAAFDSDRNDVSGRSSFVVSAGRPGLAQATQAFRVIDTAGFAAGGVAAEGFLYGASLTLPNVPVTVDNTALFATITAGGPTTVTNGPAGWTRFSGEADDNYLYSRVVDAGSANGGVVTYSAASAQTALVHAFLPIPPTPNTAPVATNRSVSTAEDTAVAVTLSATDADGDALTYRTTGGPSNGTLSGTAPNLTFTPAANFHGTSSFTFVAEDGVAVSNTATVTITVTPVNDAPVATNRSVSTAEDTAVAVTLSATDADGDALSWVISTPPASGTLSGVAPNLTYTPTAGLSGTDTFTFRVNDGTVNSNTATATITVVAVNRAPVATNRSVSTAEDTAVAVTLSATDADGDALTYRTTGGPSNGTLSGTAPNLTFTPAANFHGTSSFTFVAEDGVAVSNTATVTITVTPVNDAPVATNRSVSTAEDTAVAVTLSATDADGDALSWVISTPPASGTLSGVAPNLTYTPTAGLSGTDTFTFRVNDGTVNSNTATATITVVAVNRAPVATNRSVSTAEDTAVAVTLSATDADGDALTYRTTGGPSNGTLSGTAPNLTFTPAANFHGTSTFTFVAEDGVAVSNTATVTITVTPVNDAPVATNRSVSTAEDTAVAVTLSATDADGDTLTYRTTGGPSNGTLSGTAPNLTFTPAANFHGTRTFTFVADDGVAVSNTATVTITVTPVNDAPVATNRSVSTAEDTAIAVTLSATDADGDALTYRTTGGPSNGTLSGTAPNLTFTPAANFHGTRTFTFVADDGVAVSNTATVTITVTAVNDAPVAANASASTAAGTPVGVTLSASDVDGGALTWVIAAQPTRGTLSGVAPNLTYTPTAGLSGTDTFTFRVNDGTVNSNTATVTVTVAAPVVVAPSVASRTTARSGTVGAPAGVTAADHVAVHTLFVDQASTPPVWSSPSGLVLRYQHTRSVGSGYYFHFAAFDSNRTDVSARSSFVVSAGRSALAQATQAFRVINTSGYAAAGFAAEGFLYGSSLTLPNVAVTVDNTTLFATITAGGATTVANGPAGWTRFSGESDDNYLFSRVVNAGGANGGVVTFSAASAQTALIHAFLPPTATPPNRAPVATNMSASTTAGTPVGVMLSASDADGDALTWVIAAQPTRGTLSGVAPNLTYTPTAGLSGTDTFTFRVNDGTVNSNTATATITVTPVNDAPVATNRSLSTAEDTATAVTLSATDADGDALTYRTTGGPSNGTLSGTAPNLTFTPAANFHGTSTFTFVAEDGVAVSNTATVTITVTPVNDVPVVANASASATGTTPVAVTLSASDVDGDALTWVIASQPARGTLSGVAPNLTYEAVAGTSETDTFTFYVSDGTANSNIATATITVSAPEPPVPAPGTPTNVVAVAGNGLAQLSWAAPAGNGGPALVDYVVEIRSHGEEWVAYDDGVGTATAATVVGLTNYDEYEFRVAARHSAATGTFSPSGVATPTDGNDPADTFNRTDGQLAGQGDWVTVGSQYGVLQIVNGRLVGSRDPDGTGGGYTTAVGPNVEVTIDALLGDDYTEVSALLRMPSPDNLVGSYLMQWVTDGRFTSLGTVAGPTLQIWRIHSHIDIRLLAEVSLPDNGERTLTFGANGSTIYIAEGSTVLLSTVDTGNLTGQYFGLGQSNLDQGVMSQIDNLRWRTT